MGIPDYQRSEAERVGTGQGKAVTNLLQHNLQRHGELQTLRAEPQ